MNLEPHHLQEWLNSGVDEKLILLNVRSLLGDEYTNTCCMLYPKLPEETTDGYGLGICDYTPTSLMLGGSVDSTRSTTGCRWTGDG